MASDDESGRRRFALTKTLSPVIAVRISGKVIKRERHISAPRFSSSRSVFWLPGIGTIQGI
jgi:hypothetical protein